MRLQPVVANNLRRLVVRPVRLSNGFVLPAGIHVELAQYSVMRNPAWGWEAPNAFKPVSGKQMFCLHVHSAQPWTKSP